MNIPITNGTTVISDVDDVCDRIEDKIVELENENPANPLIQKLLDLEANVVLQEYYQWQDSNNVIIE